MLYEKTIKSSDFSDGSEFNKIYEIMNWVYSDNLILDVKYDIEYGISDMSSSTFYAEAEGGELSEVTITGIAITMIDNQELVVHSVCVEDFMKFEKFLPQDNKFYYKLAGE